jgi:hypothetical protein
MWFQKGLVWNTSIFAEYIKKTYILNNFKKKNNFITKNKLNRGISKNQRGKRE